MAKDWTYEEHVEALRQSAREDLEPLVEWYATTYAPMLMAEGACPTVESTMFAWLDRDFDDDEFPSDDELADMARRVRGE